MRLAASAMSGSVSSSVPSRSSATACARTASQDDQAVHADGWITISLRGSISTLASSARIAAMVAA